MVKTQDILNRAMNQRVTMETDAKKKRAMLFLSFFFCSMVVYMLSAYSHLIDGCAIIFFFSHLIFNP